MLEELKKRVYEANLSLVKHGLVVLTWGNVSAIDREKGVVVIKPSGVAYDKMTEDDMVAVDLSGAVVEGKLNPSTDTPTHIELYKAFPGIGGVVHTHSVNAVAFAQAGHEIQPYGTTHADFCYGTIPVTRALTDDEIKNDYEINIGKTIAEAVCTTDYSAVPAALVRNHGPFIWGSTPETAVENSVTLEVIAEMALKTLALNPMCNTAPKSLLDRHYFRKHGKNAYYGQR